MGLLLKAAAANIDEKSIRFDDPKELVVALGYEKAKALLERSYEEWKHEETYLITGDQALSAARGRVSCDVVVAGRSWCMMAEFWRSRRVKKSCA